ncbi:MAG TPA: glycosyltransferase family 39 protein [Flavipsychrobacter sp.]
MPQVQADTTLDRPMRAFAIILLVAGALLRLYIYLQNRDLIIDEANVARNIYERGFIALLQPLDYEQYAPPLFLWITKFFSLIFGLGEQSLRIYPLLCGLAAPWLFYKLLKEYLPIPTIWYPAILFAFSPIMLRYSSELKQYMPDVFIALMLIWLALNLSIETSRKARFVLLWVFIGSIAIWSSMPSVFVLAGIGCYYSWQLINNRQYKMLWLPVTISMVWVLQFAVYYLLILKDQANSQYLQNFHQYDFLFATPGNKGEWEHNWRVFSELMIRFEGYLPYVHNVNTAFLIIGTIMLLRKAAARSILLIVPVLALCAAAALNQFSMMVRVSLFIIPVLLLIVGYGFAQYYYLKSVWLKGIVIVAGLYAAGSNIYYLSGEPFKYEELTKGMSFVLEKDIPGNRVFLYHSSVPAFIYYTTIHPEREKWARIGPANRLIYETNYDSLSWQMRGVWSSNEPVAFIYTNATQEEFQYRNGHVKNHMQVADSLDYPWVKAYIFRKPGE